jgi:hypothetical protein
MSKYREPKIKGLYAWNEIHAGSFLLFVETKNFAHKFLFLPGPTEYFLTLEDFSKAVEHGVLEFVECLPDNIFSESISIPLLSCPSEQHRITT